MEKLYCSILVRANNISAGFVYCSICNNLVYHINNFFRKNNNALHFVRIFTPNIDFFFCRSLD